MPTSPPEILELAKHLRTGYLNEAGRRSAVSRAYYAAMHRAMAVFGLPAAAGSYESVHKAVIRSATERSKAPGPVRSEASRIAADLDWLRRRRAKADYDLNLDFEKVECEDCVMRADRILVLCDEAQARLVEHAAKVDAGRSAATAPGLAGQGAGEPPEPPLGPRPALKRVK